MEITLSWLWQMVARSPAALFLPAWGFASFWKRSLLKLEDPPRLSIIGVDLAGLSYPIALAIAILTNGSYLALLGYVPLAIGLALYFIGQRRRSRIKPS